MRKVKILIVDDNELNRSVTQTILEEWARLDSTLWLVTEEAEDGLEGIKKFQDHWEQHDPFQIVLLDYYMPHQNGFEAAKAIRAFLEPFSSANVTLLGYSEEYFIKMQNPTLEDTLGLQCFNDFLHKLPSEMDLYLKLEHHLKNHV